MILSSAWTCVIWVSRFEDEGDQRALGQDKWHEQMAFGAELDFGPDTEPLKAAGSSPMTRASCPGAPR
jgi:hypothetical protein